MSSKVQLSGNEMLNKKVWVDDEKLGMMKLFAGTPAECSMLALWPQETPGHQDSIAWSY